MAFAVQNGDEEITGINVTPLVDIVLVLLIIFMVTANFIVRETLEVDLPRARRTAARRFRAWSTWCSIKMAASFSTGPR